MNEILLPWTRLKGRSLTSYYRMLHINSNVTIARVSKRSMKKWEWVILGTLGPVTRGTERNGPRAKAAADETLRDLGYLPLKRSSQVVML